MTLIVDAGPLVAAADVADPRATLVQRAIEAERGWLVVPAQITAEVDYLLWARVGANSAMAFLEDLAIGRFDVECLLPEDYATVSRLANRYRDLAPGLADLSIVVLAARFRTTRILTFDQRHFRAIKPLQGGAFTLLPLDAA